MHNTDIDGEIYASKAEELAPLNATCNDPDKKLQVTNALNKLFTVDFSQMSFQDIISSANVHHRYFTVVNVVWVNPHIPHTICKTLEVVLLGLRSAHTPSSLIEIMKHS